jgi:FkbM family methyltransferase
VRILQGPARGMKWIKGSGINGYWLGSHEIPLQRALQEFLRPGSSFLDVGSNVGFFSLIAAKLVGAEGAVYAIEPLPRNAAYLKRHIELNHLDNVRVFELAACDEVGSERFNGEIEPSMCRLQDEGEIVVRTETIDNLVRSGLMRPAQFVKIDVEGAEARVLRGMSRSIGEIQPMILVATHGQSEHQQVLEILASWNYKVRGIGGESSGLADTLIAEPGKKEG